MPRYREEEKTKKIEGPVCVSGGREDQNIRGTCEGTWRMSKRKVGERTVKRGASLCFDRKHHRSNPGEAGEKRFMNARGIGVSLSFLNFVLRFTASLFGMPCHTLCYRLAPPRATALFRVPFCT